MISEIQGNRFTTEITRGKEFVLVFFFTTTCFPCKQMSPVVMEIATECKSTLKIVKFDAGKEPEFAREYGVTSAPTFVIFRGGSVVGRRTGLCSKTTLLTWIAELLETA